MKVVLFKIRVREDIDQAEYERTFEQMLELVSTVPGFRSIEGFAVVGVIGVDLAKSIVAKSLRLMRSVLRHGGSNGLFLPL